MINTLSNSTNALPTNAAKLSRSQTALDELLRQALKRGFHGTARLEIAVQDGVIQHIRRSLEQMER